MLFGVVCCAAGALYVLHAPWMRVRAVEVSGAVTIAPEAIRAVAESYMAGSYAHVLPKNSILLIAERVIEESLRRSFPLIDSVVVSVHFPDHMRVSLRERVLFGILCNDTFEPVFAGGATSTPSSPYERECGYIDAKGFVYDTAPPSSGFLITKVMIDAPRIPVGSRLIDEDVMVRITQLADALATESGIHTVGFSLRERVPSEIRAITKDGFFLIFRKDADFVHAGRVLKAVLEHDIRSRSKKLEYVDLRFGNKVFYKFKDSSVRAEHN